MSPKVALSLGVMASFATLTLASIPAEAKINGVSVVQYQNAMGTAQSPKFTGIKAVNAAKALGIQSQAPKSPGFKAVNWLKVLAKNGSLTPATSPANSSGGPMSSGNWPHWNHWNHWNTSPVLIGSAPVAIASGPVAAASPPNCLTKEYTPDGMLVFRDLCTNEMLSGRVN